MNDDVLVVVPVYNESRYISAFLEQLVTNFSHIVVIDDCSTDRSLLLAQNFNVVTLSHPFNIGQGGALNTGYFYFKNSGKFRYLLTIDGDGQHSIDDAISMLVLLKRTQSDIVFGSRFLKPSYSTLPFFKRLTLYFARAFEFLIFRVRNATDSHNGLRIMTAKAASHIFPLLQPGMAHATEIRVKSQFIKLIAIEFPTLHSYKNVKSQSVLNAINIVTDLLFS